MGKLCKDMLTEVLARVPASSLIRLKLTCKSWYALISHPLFVKLHSERLRTDARAAHPKILIIDILPHQMTMNGISPRSIDFEEFEGYRVEKAIINPREKIGNCLAIRVGGSCDGLIPFIRLSSGHLITSLWNPLTNEVRDLPKRLNVPRHSDRVCYGLGFGYDRGTDDYKVIRTVHSQNKRGLKKSIVDIFALKVNAWRRIYDNPKGKFSCDSLYLNGAVHWLVRHINEAEDSHAIISFDLATEKFQDLSIPGSNESSRCHGIGILDGCLLGYTVYWEQNGRFEAWKMEEYGMTTSWAKVISIPGKLLPTPSEYVQLICIKNGKILLGLDMKEIVLFDIEEESCQFLLDIGWSGWHYKSVVSVESLISPYTGYGKMLLKYQKRRRNLEY